MPKIRTSSPGSDDKRSPGVENPGEKPAKANDEFKEATDISTKNDEKVVDATLASPGDIPHAAADAGSKKRAREDDDGAEEQGNTKKVDAKVED